MVSILQGLSCESITTKRDKADYQGGRRGLQGNHE
jgi:hypothetical protein